MRPPTLAGSLAPRPATMLSGDQSWPTTRGSTTSRWQASSGGWHGHRAARRRSSTCTTRPPFDKPCSTSAPSSPLDSSSTCNAGVHRLDRARGSDRGEVAPAGSPDVRARRSDSHHVSRSPHLGTRRSSGRASNGHGRRSGGRGLARCASPWPSCSAGSPSPSRPRLPGSSRRASRPTSRAMRAGRG